jgi:hypothetical protein
MAQGSRCLRPVALVLAALVLALTTSAKAQSSRSQSAALPARFESWRAPSLLDVNPEGTIRLSVVAPANRKRQALIGGAIGAAAGLVGCTVISTLTDDSAEGGLSFCPLDSYLLIGGAGFVVGAVIGWVI